MNTNFVNIKVDREERPEIDKIYMTFVQLTTGHGGWPLSVWLTPDLHPFFGGTYFPPNDRHGRPGFRTLLLSIAQRWKNDRQKLEASGAEVVRVLKSVAASETPSETADDRISEEVAHTCYRSLKSAYDRINGGFSASPKFPTPSNLNFLMRYSALERTHAISETNLMSISPAELRGILSSGGCQAPEDASREELVAEYRDYIKGRNAPAQEALDMCLHTLRSMAKGGIHDHISKGFHRYATDRTWHVPHFEKMLYDQGQLAVVYLEAFQITKEPLFASVADDILQYVQTCLRDPRGGFYCAEDADSKETFDSPSAIEGSFYVWTLQEVEDILGEDDAKVFAFRYGMERSGNVPRESDIQGELEGKNVLFEKYDILETAKHFGKSDEETSSLLNKSRKKLYAHQQRRPRPNLDDKIVTAWNGLMISAYSKAFQILGNKDHLTAALEAASFFLDHMYDGSTRTLLRSFRNGPSNIQGFSDDYAFFIQGLLDLYDSTLDEKWLLCAKDLQVSQDEQFWDSESKGYYSSSGKDPTIILRMKDDQDGAEPSANSVSALNLFRLSNLLDDSSMAEQTNAIFDASGQMLQQSPRALTFMASALLIYLRSSTQILIVGEKDDPDTQRMLDVVNRKYIPNRVLMVVDPKNNKSLLHANPVVRQSNMINSKPTAYVCKEFQCSLPTNSVDELDSLLPSQ